MYFIEIAFVFCRRIRAKSDTVPKIVQCGSGHHRIHINQADYLICFAVDHYIIQFRIIMRHANGNPFVRDPICNNTVKIFSTFEKLNFFL